MGTRKIPRKIGRLVRKGKNRIAFSSMSDAAGRCNLDPVYNNLAAANSAVNEYLDLVNLEPPFGNEFERAVQLIVEASSKVFGLPEYVRANCDLKNNAQARGVLELLAQTDSHISIARQFNDQYSVEDK